MAAVTLHHFSGLAAPFVRSTRTVSGDVFKYLLKEEDFFQELVLHCEEAELSSGGTFLERACREIDAELYEQVQNVYRLYNPHRNLYLDKCCGESKRPLGEWMDFTKYEE